MWPLKQSRIKEDLQWDHTTCGHLNNRMLKGFQAHTQLTTEYAVSPRSNLPLLNIIHEHHFA